MNTLPAKTILDGATHAIGWDLTQLESRQKEMRREAFSLALQEVWEKWWWEELMVATPTPAAPVYAAATPPVAGTFYYFPGTQQYYLCLIAATGQAPATYYNGAWSTNYGYWAEARADYSGQIAPDYTVGLNDTGLALGALVRNPTDGLYYQLVAFNAGYVVSGAGSPEWNGTYLPEGDDGFGNPADWAGPGGTLRTTLVDILGDGTQIYAWILNNQADTAYQQTASGTALLAMPPITNPWTVVVNGAAPCPTVSRNATYGGPTDPTNWRPVTAFLPTLELAGKLRSATRRDPRGRPDPQGYYFQETAAGAQLFNVTHGQPWLWYRRVTPIVTGDPFDASVSYAATPAPQLTYHP